MQAIDFFEDSERTMVPLFQAVNQFERAWRTQLPQELQDEFDANDDISSLVTPDIYNNIRALRAAFRELIFAHKPFGVLSEPGYQNRRNERIEKAEAVLQAQLDMQHQNVGFASEADKAVHQALYAGITCCYDAWTSVVESVPERDPQTQEVIYDNGRPRLTRKEVVSYAETKFVDIRRVRVDPAPDSWDKLRIVGIQSMENLGDVLEARDNPSHFYDFDIEDIKRSSFSRDLYFQYVRGEMDQMTERGKQRERYGDKVLEKWEVRGLFRVPKDQDVNDYVLSDLIVCIGNRTKLLGAKHNDLPIASWDLFHFPVIQHETSRMFPMGAVEPVMDLWIEKFIKRNQSLDAAGRSVYPVYIADRTAGAELPEILERDADRVYQVDLAGAGIDDVNKVIAPLKVGDSGINTFEQSADLTNDINVGMGSTDYFGPSRPSRRDSATAVAELVSSGRQLLGQIAKSLADSYLIPSWRNHLKLWTFFLGHKTTVITASDGRELSISPAELDGFWVVAIDIATALDQPDMIRRFIEFWPTIKNDPFYDPYELRRTANMVLRLPNPDRILKSPEHLQMIVTREDMAMIKGAWMPVHPQDNHALHFEYHTNNVNAAQEMLEFPEMMQLFLGVDLSAMESKRAMAVLRSFIEVETMHLSLHEDEIKKMNSALGNTKDLGGNAGGSIGQGSIMKRGGTMGYGTPSAARA